MDFQHFKKSVAAKAPPGGLSPAALALWWDAKGDWDKAHASAQEGEDKAGAWVHAYLHRKEGDLSNAGYWYRRAGKAVATSALEAEWEAIARALLKNS
jgi:hypothetical protein